MKAGIGRMLGLARPARNGTGTGDPYIDIPGGTRYISHLIRAKHVLPVARF